MTIKTTKHLKISILVLGFFLSITNLVNASSLNPSILDIQIEVDTEKSGTLEYLNTSDSVAYLKPLILAYDAKNENIIDKGNVFLKTKDKLYEVEAGESIEIPYSIKFEQNITEGTYFNILAMISQSELEISNNLDLDETQFNINIGEGALFAFHVKKDGRIDVFQALDIELTSSRDWFISYLYPATARVTVQNNSNFVFDIGGELKSINKSGEVLDVNRYGGEFTKLYPGDGIEMVSSASLGIFEFDDISFIYTLGENILNQKEIGSLSVKNYSLYMVVSFGVIGILGLLFIIKRLYKRNIKHL